MTKQVLQQQPVQTPLFDCDIQPRPLAHPLCDYHSAPSEGPLNYTWQDKPHRLLYDLIAAVRYYAGAAPAAQQGGPVAKVFLHTTGGNVGLSTGIRWLQDKYGCDFNLPPETLLYTEAAPAVQPDARKVIEQMVDALEDVNRWRNTGVGRPPEQTSMAAIQAGQQWMEENK